MYSKEMFLKSEKISKKIKKCNYWWHFCLVYLVYLFQFCLVPLFVISVQSSDSSFVHKTGLIFLVGSFYIVSDQYSTDFSRRKGIPKCVDETHHTHKQRSLLQDSFEKMPCCKIHTYFQIYACIIFLTLPHCSILNFEFVTHIALSLNSKIRKINNGSNFKNTSNLTRQ